MHIPDGVLSLPVLAVGFVGGAAALAVSLPSVKQTELPKVAVVSAMFFVVSLVNFPVGPSSVHLVLSGLMGLLLGRAIIPAVFISLLLQAIFFGFGGLTTLGVTTLNIALPGLLWATLIQPAMAHVHSPMGKGALGGLVALLSVTTSACLVILALGVSDRAYFASAAVVLLTYLPLAIIEALATAVAVGFLVRVKPAALTLWGKPA